MLPIGRSGRARLATLVLGGALALALPLGGATSATAAGYPKDCERPTGKSKIGCLGKPVTLPDPATGGVKTLRPITFDFDDDPGAGRKLRLKPRNLGYHGGVADAQGRTLVVPRYGRLEFLSAQAAWASVDGGYVDTVVINIATDTATALPFKQFVRYSSADDRLSMVFGVAAKHADGREDWRHVQMDGTLGRTLEGVIAPTSHFNDKFRSGGLRAGPFIIVNQSPKGDGKVYSNWMDITGATAFTGLAAVDYGGQMMVRVGDTPIPFDARETGAYVPVDENGRPVAMPDGVAAIAPILPGEGDYYGARGWALIMKNGEYRFGQGPLKDVLANPSKTMVLEEIASVKPTVRASGASEVYRKLAIRLKGRGWMLPGAVGEQGAEFPTAVDAVNSPNIRYNAVIDRLDAERKAKLAAEAAYQERSRAEAKALFASHMAKSGGVPNLRSVAMTAGDEESAAWLGRYGISTYGLASDGNDVAQWCAVGPKACAVAQAQLQGKERDRMAQIAERSAVDAALRGFATPRAPADVKVTIYEGGRVRTEVWSADHVKRMTGK